MNPGTFELLIKRSLGRASSSERLADLNSRGYEDRDARQQAGRMAGGMEG